jgi:hypothetical protein
VLAADLSSWVGLFAALHATSRPSIKHGSLGMARL